MGKFSYIWFLEFQSRGAPHYHLMSSLDEPDEKCRVWWAGLWAGLATGGQSWYYSSIHPTSTGYRRGVKLCTLDAIRWYHQTELRTWSNFREVDGAARYAAKYALKTYQKSVPVYYQDVGRFWGASRDMVLPEGEVVVGGEVEIREFLSLKGRDFSGFDVLPKLITY